MDIAKVVFIAALAGLATLFATVREKAILDGIANLAQALALVFAVFNWANSTNRAARKSIFLKERIRFAMAIALWVVGQVLLTFSEVLLHQTAYGTVADPFWLIGYVLMISAFLVVIQDQKQNMSGGRFWIPGMLLIGVYLLIFIFFLSRVVLSPERNWIWRLLDLAYSALSYSVVALSFILFRMFRVLKEDHEATRHLWLSGAFLLCMIADIVFSYHTDFDSFVYRAVGLVYFVAYSTIAFAGRYPKP